MIDSGERNVTTIERAMQAILTGTPGVEPDYAVLRHPDTLEELTEALPQMVALIAARVGTTRLIDNEVVSSGM